MYRTNSNLIFSKGSIETIYNKKYTSLKSAIDGESDDYLLNVNELTYVEHLVSRHLIDPPAIHFDQMTVDSYEDDIPAEYFPFSYNVYKGQAYKQEVIQFFIACTGDINLLYYTPSNIIPMSRGGNFHIQNDTIVTEIIKFSNSAEEIKRLLQIEIDGIHRYYSALIKDIEAYNQSLKREITSYFSARKSKILSNKNLLSSLGVPFRNKEKVPATFAIPNPKFKEMIQIKPEVYEKGFKPEPRLDNESYQKILKLINDVGKNFERLPSVYKDKGEEDLRDHVLMTLDPNFELGSASGETFNKTGKTDIQLRYDSSVVFIAECKFWSGEKKYLEGIDQLLKYLTWRDTKASIIVFVKQLDFTTILDKISKVTSEHPNYLRFVSKTDENWFNFEFHIIGDKNREVKLAILLFHLPAIKEK
jgi:hypothetical protein